MAKARGKTTQLKDMYVADFETCDSNTIYKTDNVTGKPVHYQRVWLAGHKNLETMESKVFTNIRDFMDDILAKKNRNNREVGFHNLKYDGSYIVPELFKMGYVVADGKPKAKEFSVLVDDMNNWYTIVVQVNARRKVTFWDTSKLFPMALEYLPHLYSTPTHKVRENEDFYNAIRDINHVPTKQELAYFENDLQVPAEVIKRHIELVGIRFKKTQASQSFYNFEQVFEHWRLRFRALDVELDKKVRSAYWGGISYVPPQKQGNDYYKISVADINSSYPHKASECKLPYDYPIKETEGQHPTMAYFWVAEVVCKFKLKDEDKLPCIPKKSVIEGEIVNKKGVDKWVRDSDGVAKITISSIDYRTIQMSYDFEVLEWGWCVHWKHKVHKEVAKFVYMNNDNKIKYGQLSDKETDTEKKNYYKALRQRAKIDNNSFYGKFGEEIVKEGKTPYLDEETEEIHWATDRVDTATEHNRKFLPVAIAITAYGRQQLVEVANLLGEDFLYCDTDSVHYLHRGHEKLKELDFDKHKLGAWDYEGYYVRGRYLRAKCYMEEKEDGTREATVAGLPPDKHSGLGSKKRSCLNWNNFHIGTVIPQDKTNKLRTYRTPTGNKLLPTSFEIKERGMFT